jgi:hypothetical protein
MRAQKAIKSVPRHIQDAEKHSLKSLPLPTNTCDGGRLYRPFVLVGDYLS